ncbi:hypothetical protein PpBr36_02616 [Pyricularia pennisetigena]|uniref:hypothetical protein n=1 Tax=Pyricularia pennisetigena TaxID=1578925 RepID=UPI00114D8C2F|nr:hypothetical protein PpBr36_02616 [Pyricularia pennisetigena]TLS30051.1 hypothetical protein PpBr36_02616 [Pyricularia pennisetigena]
MAGKVYLITGVNRGIGHGLFKYYASQPNNTVIGTVRDLKHAQALLDEPRGTDTNLIVTKLDASSKTDPYSAVEDIRSKGVDHIDVVISNAAVAQLFTLEDLPIEVFEEHITINSVAVLLLYKATLPLLRASAFAKFTLISAAGGSIGSFAGTKLPFGAYGASKALSNYLLVKMGAENDWLVTLCIHPGHVQTDMGDFASNAFGIDIAPVTIDQCVKDTTEIIEKSTKEDHSGKFFDRTIDSFCPW